LGDRDKSVEDVLGSSINTNSHETAEK
jgi:hypothetical protein